ncbi:MAG: pentapeptide repeat-containing protein [Saprospiraceae bacterium]
MNKRTLSDMDTLINSHNLFMSGEIHKGIRLPTDFFHKKDFTNCIIPSIRGLSGYPIQDAQFTNVVFNQIDFNAAFLYGSRFNSCIFNECSFIKSELGGIVVKGTLFKNCDFFRASLNNAEVNGCLFNGCNLNKAILSETKFQNCLVNYYGIPIKNDLKESNVIWKNEDSSLHT